MTSASFRSRPSLSPLLTPEYPFLQPFCYFDVSTWLYLKCRRKGKFPARILNTRAAITIPSEWNKYLCRQREGVAISCFFFALWLLWTGYPVKLNKCSVYSSSYGFSRSDSNWFSGNVHGHWIQFVFLLSLLLSTHFFFFFFIFIHLHELNMLCALLSQRCQEYPESSTHTVRCEKVTWLGRCACSLYENLRVKVNCERDPTPQIKHKISYSTPLQIHSC